MPPLLGHGMSLLPHVTAVSADVVEFLRQVRIARKKYRDVRSTHHAGVGSSLLGLEEDDVLLAARRAGPVFDARQLEATRVSQQSHRGAGKRRADGATMLTSPRIARRLLSGYLNAVSAHPLLRARGLAHFPRHIPRRLCPAHTWCRSWGSHPVP